MDNRAINQKLNIPKRYELVKCAKCPLAEQITLSEDEKYVRVAPHNKYELPIEEMNKIADQCGLFKSNFELLFEQPLKE